MGNLVGWWLRTNRVQSQDAAGVNSWVMQDTHHQCRGGEVGHTIHLPPAVPAFSQRNEIETG